MFSTTQTALVAALRERLGSLGQQAGELQPLRVDPYGGELLRDGLIDTVPAAWVDVRTAAVEPDDEGGELLVGELSVDLVLAARNAASGGAQYSDGLALASWALRALTSAPFVLGGIPLRPRAAIRFERIASGERLWAGKLTFTLEVDA